MLKPEGRMINPAGLLAVLAAFFYATNAIIIRRMGKTESGLSLAFYPTIHYIIFSAIVATALNYSGLAANSGSYLAFLVRNWQFPDQVDLFLIALTGMISAAGLYFLSQAYRLAPSSMIAPIEYVAVPMSVAWGYIVWNDILEPRSIIGLVLIVGSGLYIFGGKKAAVGRQVMNIFRIKLRR
jgi:drug/metabolite transporter (DMT)-like permease